MSDYTRGQPDWSSGGARTFAGAGGSDLELGSRLWWPLAQVYDGEVHFWDDFEAGVLHWNADSDSSDGEVTLDRVRANSGEQSVKLLTPATADEQTYIGRGLFMPLPGTVGFGGFFSPEGEIGTVDLFCRGVYDGQRSYFRLRYDFDSGLAQVQVSGGYETIASLPNLYTVSNSFVWVQLVVDFDNQLYKMAKIGSAVILLDQDPYLTGALAYPDYMEIVATYETPDAVNRALWVDDIIVTRNVQVPTE